MSVPPDQMSGVPGTDGLTDDDIQALVTQMGGVSATPEKNQALEHQLAMAKLLRGGADMPQGQMAGHVYVGPNALQSLAAAGNAYLAHRQGDQAIQAMMDNANQQQDARTSYMKAIAQALRNKQSPSQSMDPAQGVDINDIAANDA